MADGAPGSGGTRALAYGAQPAGGHNYLASNFTTVAAGTIASLTLNAVNASGSPGVTTVLLYADTGGGQPATSSLATATSTIQTTGTSQDFTLNFSPAVSVSASTKYWVVVNASPSAANFPGWNSVANAQPGAGNWQSDDGSTWVTGSYNNDQCDAVITVTTPTPKSGFFMAMR